MPQLQPIGQSIWLVEGGLVNFYGFPYPTRSVIARLPDGDLWVWSPIELTEGLAAEVDSLGNVRHLVSPNKIHHLYLQDWQTRFPNALLWGPASTVRKRPDLQFEPALTDNAPQAWQGEIESVWFRGSKAMDEIVFFHHPSRTAIIADLSENFSDSFLNTHWGPIARFVAKLWKIKQPWGYAPLELRLSWLDRAPARQSLRKLLAWQPQQVVMAHGEWQPTDGTLYLQRAFAWLKP